MTESMVENQDILKKLNAGKEQGMEDLFARYYKPLVVYAGFYLHDLEEAEDLVQDQMVKLWAKHAFVGITAEVLSHFLFTVVKNACINWLEKKKLPVTSLDLPHFQIALEESEQMNEMTVKLVRDAVGKLPERTRLVVECVVMDGKAYKEAAEELGVSVNTIKTLLRQGIKELREMLGNRQDCLLLLYMRCICEKIIN